MPELILHHYPISPFAEKIRAILGFKRLAWRSVTIPVVMPKPDLVALTGGYRKTPVLQIGADVYCDTKLIARVLDRVQPDPPLVPRGLEASVAMIEQWTEQTLFLLMAMLPFQPKGLAHLFGQQPDLAAQFQKDREGLFAGGKGRRPSMGATLSELPGFSAALEAQLGATPFVLGPQPTLADFSVYHSYWAVLSNPGVAAALQPYPNLRAWAARLAAFGHGTSTPMSATDAIAAARAQPPDTACGAPDWPDPSGVKPGDAIVVSAADYGADPVTGRLLASSRDEVALLRSDPRAGDVVVHFPRAGFRIAAPK
jgi:glutathione S-transferase